MVPFKKSITLIQTFDNKINEKLILSLEMLRKTIGIMRYKKNRRDYNPHKENILCNKIPT